MKSFKRRALAFILTTAMVLTSLVVPTFAAPTNTGKLYFDEAETVDGNSYYGGTLKYRRDASTVDISAWKGWTDYQAELRSSGIAVGLMLLGNTKESVDIYKWDVAEIEGGKISNSNVYIPQIIDKFTDIQSLTTGEYTASVFIYSNSDKVEGAGWYTIDETDSFKFLSPVTYPEPVITDSAIGSTWKFKVEVPEGTTCKAELKVKHEDGVTGTKEFTFDAGNHQQDTEMKINEGDCARVIVKLYSKASGFEGFQIPVGEATTAKREDNGTVSDEITATVATPTDLPKLCEIAGNRSASDNKFYARAGEEKYTFEIATPDGTTTFPTQVECNGKVYPATDNLGELPGDDFADAGEYQFTISFKDYPDLKSTATLIVRDKAEITVEDKYTMTADGVDITGTSPEIDGAVMITFADNSEETTTVDEKGNWKLHMPYSKDIIGKATVKVFNSRTEYRAEKETTIEEAVAAELKVWLLEENGVKLAEEGVYEAFNDVNQIYIKATGQTDDIDLYLDGSKIGNIQGAAGYSLNYPYGCTLSVGEHKFKAQYRDTNIEGEAAEITLNILDENADIVTVTTTPVYAKKDMVIEGTGIAGSKIEIYAADNTVSATAAKSGIALFTGDVLLGSTTVTPAGTWTATLDLSGVTPGAKAIYVKGSKIDKTVKLDVDVLSESTTAGDITITADPYTNKNTELVFNVAADTDKNIDVYVDGVKVKTNVPAGEIKVTPGDIAKTHFDDAEFEIKVTYTDASYTNEATAKITVDTIAPAKATINTVDDEATEITGTAEAGATVSAYIGTELLGMATADSATGEYTITITKQTVGTEIIVRVTDLAGNVSEDATTTVVASAAGDIVITTDRYTKDQTKLVVEVSADAGKNINVYVNGTKVVDNEPAGTFTIPAGEITGTILSEGDYEVKAEYAAPGYDEKTVTATVTVDITAPAAAVIDEVTDSTTTVTGTAEAGATVELFVAGTSLGTVTVDSDGTWSKAITAQSAGTVITAKVTDAAGNEGPETTTTVVTTASVITPVVTPAYAEYDGKYYSNNINEIKFNVEATAGMNINAYINGTVKAVENQPAGDFTYTMPIGKLTEGEYTITAEYVLPGYTTGTATLVIDTAEPVVGTINEVDDRDTEITGTADAAEAGATVKAYVDGVQIGTDATVEADGTWTITGITPLDVDKEITVEITDVAGNKGTDKTTVVKTTREPIVITADAYTKKNDKLYFSVEAEADEILKVYVTGPAPAAEKLIYDTADGKKAGDFTIDASQIDGVTLDDGEYTVRVTYAKAAYEDIEGEAVITVDTAAPTTLSGHDNIYDDDTTATLTLAAGDEGATVELTIGTDTYTGTDTDNDGVIEIAIDRHNVDTEISAVVTDLAGNASEAITAKVLKRDGVQAITVTTDEIYLSNPASIVYTVDAAAGRAIEATISDGTNTETISPVIIGENTVSAGALFSDKTVFPEGEYVITVKYADPAYAELAGSLTVTVINGKPAPAIVDPSTGDNETTAITGKVEPAKAGLTAFTEITGTEYTGLVDETTGEFTIDISAAELEVDDVIEVGVRDAAGNVADIPAAYTSHRFTVTAKDIKKIVVTPELTFDSTDNKYYADSTEVLPSVKAAVEAEAGYDVKVTIAGTNADTTFNATEITITGSGDVEFTYNPTVAGYGFAPEAEYTISAEYVKHGFDDKVADDVTVAVVKETADVPVINTITDRDLTITGTNAAFATVEVSFDDGATWASAAIDTTDNTVWSYTLTDVLTAGDKVLARQTLKGGKVSDNAEATVVFAEIIDLELGYGTDCELGTTHDTDKFDITLKADAGRTVLVTVKHTQENGIVVIPDGWNAKEIVADGTVQTFTVERDTADTHYEEGEWIVTAEYKDKAAMEAQGLTAALDDTLTVTVIGNPEAPTLVEPAEVTNRTTEITVEMGDYAKTAKVYADGTELTTGVTVTPGTGNQWKIEIPMQLAGTELKITEVDTSDVESADALEITVAYDSRIAIEITATSTDDDRVADLEADGADLVISGTTTEVLDGTEVIVSAVSASNTAYALTEVTTTVTGNTWTATFPYNAAAFGGLKEGDITITATLNDEGNPQLTATVTIVNDKTTPDKPVIVGSSIDGADVDGKLTTRSTEIYGTAANEAGGTVTVVVKDENDAEVETITTIVDANGEWRAAFGEELKVGYSVEVTVTDLAGHVSDAAEADVTTAEVQKYELTIDDLTNPYINTLALANGNETDGKLTFTGTTTAHDTDKVVVTINVPWGGTAFTKEAQVTGGVWTVTFGDDTATETLIKRLSDTTLIASERTEGTKVTVTAAYAEEGITVSDEDTTNNTTTIYPDSTAPTAPVIITEPVYNRTTVVKVESTTDYVYGSETPADHGTITLYADGAEITPLYAPQFDFATKTWTIDIDALNKDVVLTATETDEAGNKSELSEAKTVVEAIEGDDEDAGEVKELLITDADGKTIYTVGTEKTVYLNNTATTNITLSGEGADEKVRVSFKSLDNGNNADSVITGAKEFTISGNAWDVELNLGALINTLPENRYEFKIEYINTTNSSEEGVIGEDYLVIVIDNQAPDALTVNTVYDRDLTVSGGGLETYPTDPVNYEFWYRVDNADGSERSDWAQLDADKVTNVNGVWTVSKSDIGLESGIRKELGTKVSFKQIDRAGNESTPVAATVVELTNQGNIDAADIKIISPANKATVARGTTQLTIKGTAEPNERISVKIDDVHEYTVDEMTVNADGTWEVTFGNATTAEFTTGTHTITAKYLDIKDNVTNELYTVTSTFKVPAETKPSTGGGGGGGSAKWDDITVTEKTVVEGTGTLNGKGERGKDVAIYYKEKNDTLSGMGTLVGKATVDSQGVWKITETSDKFKELEAGEYILNATYEVGEGTTRGKYKNDLTITAKDPADSAYILFTVGSLEYKVDGVKQYTDVAPYIDSNDRTMLPLRAFANALSISNEDITWDDATKTATIVRPDGKKVVVQVGRNVIVVNGVETVIDTVPVIKEARVFLPLRAMLNAFGIADSRIVWSAEKGQIIIVQDAKADLQALVDAAEKAEDAVKED